MRKGHGGAFMLVEGAKLGAERGIARIVAPKLGGFDRGRVETRRETHSGGYFSLPVCTGGHGTDP
jgi:hypothetical protein